MTHSSSPVGAPLFHTGDFTALVEQGRLNVAGDYLRRRVERIIEAGFDAVELSLDAVHVLPDAFDDAFVSFLAGPDVADRLVLTAHLPFLGLALLSPLEGMREQSLRRMLAAYERVAHLPVRHWVVHLDAAFPPMLEGVNALVRDEHTRRVRERGCWSLDRLLETIPRERLLVENLPNMPLANIVYWAAKHDLGTCLDAGHVLLRGESFDEHLEALGPRIRELHVHDIVERNGSQLDHQPLGSGIVPLEELQRLAASAPEGVPVILEMPLEWACRSLRVWRGNQGQWGC